VKISYDRSYDPPMPVVPVRISGVEADGPGILVHAILDTGADCSVIPERHAQLLHLPMVDVASVHGFADGGKTRPLYAARLRIGARNLLARVIAYGSEPLLGRDVLNQLVVRLDGPELQLQLTSPPPRSKRMRKR
jgi:predicted aspartyl protease